MSWTDEFSDESAQNQDLIKMVLINKERKVRISVELKDKDGSPVVLKEVIANILEYISDKLGDKTENSFTEQIYPLMAQTLAAGVATLVPTGEAAYILTSENIKNSYMTMMSVGFLLLQYIKQNNYTIYSIEEPVSDEEIEAWDKRSRATSIATKAHMLGIEFDLAVALLNRKGHISVEEAGDLLGYSVTSEDLNNIINNSSVEDALDDDTDDSKNSN